jgi:hypothetical protein
MMLHLNHHCPGALEASSEQGGPPVQLCGFSASSRLALEVCKSTVPKTERSPRKEHGSLETGSLARQSSSDATGAAAGKRRRAAKLQTYRTGPPCLFPR